MREGLRVLSFTFVAVMAATTVHAARNDGKGETAVRLTLEVDWNVPSLPELPASSRTSPISPPPLDLEITQGRILEAMPWPRDVAGECESRPGGSVRLGTARTGRVRVRVEAPLSASLIVRTGGFSAPFSISALLEAPQRTAPPVEIGMTRLAWDPLEVRLEEGDGTIAPGGTIPLSVGFNVLTPDPCEVYLRCSAELRPIRGGEPVAQVVREQTVHTNVATAPVIVMKMQAPQAEGTYVLEVRSSWKAIAAREGSRIGRLIRRHRLPPPSGAVRRTTLVVLGTKPTAPPASKSADEPVDSFDLTRVRGNRPAASGRGSAPGVGQAAWKVPGDALIEAARRDFLRGLIGRNGNDLSHLGPADASGIPWSAIGLKVTHPGRPHRLTIRVIGGEPAGLGVALLVPEGNGNRPRILLDAAVTGARVAEGEAPSPFSWPVWPDAAEPILVVFNRGTTPVRLGTVELTELRSDAAPATLAETHAETPRFLGLHLTGPHALDRFGAAVEGAPDDTLALARNLTSYLTSCGASVAVLADDLADRTRRLSLDGQADEDSTGPDVLGLILRAFETKGLSALVELRPDAPLPGLPAPDSIAALQQGMVRVDGRGLADGSAYHLLHPDVRAAFKKRVAEAVALRKSRANLIGLLIRLGPGSTLLGSPDTGLDDVTYARFVAEALTPEAARNAPGLGSDQPNRFTARRQYLAGPGKMPWLSWRARMIGSLYAELAQTTHETAPGAILAVATPGPDEGPAGLEARQGDRAGLPPQQAWRAVGLDLENWPAPGPGGPVVLRGVGLSTDAIGHDLATHPELDALIVKRPERGLLLWDSVPEFDEDDLVLTSAPVAAGPAGDEPLGHALAVLDARWVLLAPSAVAGREERVARFARVFRALPANAQPPSARLESGVAVRTWPSGGKTYLGLANDTPYTIRLDALLLAPSAAAVDDLGRGLLLDPQPASGGKRLVIELDPFGVAAVRVGGRDVRVEKVVPYPLDDLKAEYQSISARLARLAQGGGNTGPPNPTFEAAASTRTPVAEIRTARAATLATGWSALGDKSNVVEIDSTRPHAGQGSLRLDAKALPAAVVSEPFPAPGGSSLTLRAWFRTDRPDAKVRVRLEGEAAGRPVVRQVDLTTKAEWTEREVRATDLPATGLDRVRLRFELLSPGHLWIDDVAVSGQGPSESELRAQRILVTAMQAYREGRYADFARLAGSRSARAIGEESAAPPSARIAADRPAPIRTGDASDLSPGRRLR